MVIGAIAGIISSYLFVVPSQFWFTGRSEQTERIIGFESVNYSKEVIGALLKSMGRELWVKSAIQDPGLAENANFWDGFSENSYEEVKKLLQNGKRKELSLLSDAELFHALICVDDNRKMLARKEAEALFAANQEQRTQTVLRLLTSYYYDQWKSSQKSISDPAKSAPPAH
jgi:hypothetical protein